LVYKKPAYVLRTLCNGSFSGKPYYCFGLAIQGCIHLIFITPFTARRFSGMQSKITFPCHYLLNIDNIIKNDEHFVKKTFI